MRIVIICRCVNVYSKVKWKLHVVRGKYCIYVCSCSVFKIAKAWEGHWGCTKFQWKLQDAELLARLSYVYSKAGPNNKVGRRSFEYLFDPNGRNGVKWEMKMAYASTEVSEHIPSKVEKEGYWGLRGLDTISQTPPFTHHRALCSDKETTIDFLGKHGALYLWLNLISKPMPMELEWALCIYQGWYIAVKLGQQMTMLSLQLSAAKLTFFSLVHLHLVMPCLPWWFVHGRKPYLTIWRMKQFLTSCLDAVRLGDSIGIFTLSGSCFSFKTNPQPDQYCFSRMGVHLTFRLNYVIELAHQSDVQPYLTATRCHVCHKYIINHPGWEITSDVIVALVAEV